LNVKYPLILLFIKTPYKQERYEMSSITDVQNNLRKVRKSKGLTLAQVEALSNGVHKSVVVGSYERGSRSISVDKLIALAEFYEVSISEFFGTPSTHTPSANKMALIPLEDLMGLLGLQGKVVVIDGE
jgi:transcriptional regulator with XRE-family HTH domain